ncbi:LysR family transcriptional regulator [Beijerinckia indica]|uniref:Transcriptional regulator, LysR family n=1 Tax=Beijerinckia indica subsp. indica (strain ATCC 9039 / DSM 1715 / NCIMB 8712) TaxID=395963 RepID=B2IKS9_BEII9|nr:LysR family transcriptional regulator [Beijerinckia indica]ACB95118.1 transcriptional regulator, LysR family [Beijerinckia indica subsp. indica ATCC 9039]
MKCIIAIMNITQKHLPGIDLDLLPVLDALLRRRNVTHAGREVGLSQPAMSRALGRLRHLFDDPLLVRQAGGFALTPKAQRLAPQVAIALEQVGALFRDAPFDPAAEQRTIRIVAADAQTLLLLPEVMRRVSREAPGIRVAVEGYSPETITHMQQGRIDFAFALASSPLPPGAESMTLGTDRLMLVTRRDHPLAAGPVSAEDYARFPHVAITIFGDGQSEIDAALAARRLSRTIALTTPYFAAALAVVAATDYVTTLSEALARRFSDTFSLVIRPSPLIAEPHSLTLVWDRIRSKDPALFWFRELVRDVAVTIYG